MLCCIGPYLANLGNTKRPVQQKRYGSKIRLKIIHQLHLLAFNQLCTSMMLHILVCRPSGQSKQVELLNFGLKQAKFDCFQSLTTPIMKLSFQSFLKILSSIFLPKRWSKHHCQGKGQVRICFGLNERQLGCHWSLHHHQLSSHRMNPAQLSAFCQTSGSCGRLRTSSGQSPLSPELTILRMETSNITWQQSRNRFACKVEWHCLRVCSALAFKVELILGMCNCCFIRKA